MKRIKTSLRAGSQWTHEKMYHNATEIGWVCRGIPHVLENLKDQYVIEITDQAPVSLTFTVFKKGK